jgi:hypothetical protein
VDQGVNLSRPGLTLRPLPKPPVQPCTPVCLTVTQGPKSLGITGPSLPLDTPLVHLDKRERPRRGVRPLPPIALGTSHFGTKKSPPSSTALCRRLP